MDQNPDVASTRMNPHTTLIYLDGFGDCDVGHRGRKVFEGMELVKR